MKMYFVDNGQSLVYGKYDIFYHSFPMLFSFTQKKTVIKCDGINCVTLLRKMSQSVGNIDLNHLHIFSCLFAD